MKFDSSECAGTLIEVEVVHIVIAYVLHYTNDTIFVQGNLDFKHKNGQKDVKLNVT